MFLCLWADHQQKANSPDRSGKKDFVISITYLDGGTDVINIKCMEPGFGGEWHNPPEFYTVDKLFTTSLRLICTWRCAVDGRTAGGLEEQQIIADNISRYKIIK